MCVYRGDDSLERAITINMWSRLDPPSSSLRSMDTWSSGPAPSRSGITLLSARAHDCGCARPPTSISASKHNRFLVLCWAGTGTKPPLPRLPLMMMLAGAWKGAIISTVFLAQEPSYGKRRLKRGKDTLLGVARWPHNGVTPALTGCIYPSSSRSLLLSHSHTLSSPAVCVAHSHLIAAVRG